MWEKRPIEGAIDLRSHSIPLRYSTGLISCANRNYFTWRYHTGRMIYVWSMKHIPKRSQDFHCEVLFPHFFITYSIFFILWWNSEGFHHNDNIFDKRFPFLMFLFFCVIKMWGKQRQNWSNFDFMFLFILWWNCEDFSSQRQIITKYQ